MGNEPVKLGARIAAWFAPSPLATYAAATEKPTRAAVTSPAREPERNRATPMTALSLAAFYRGVSIHATAASQLDLRLTRNGSTPEILTAPSWLQNPDAAGEGGRPAFIEYTVTSLYLDGNAFWHVDRLPDGSLFTLTPWNPNEVSVQVERRDSGRDVVTYGYRGHTYRADEVRHLKLLRVPGIARGLGPIAACTMTVRGALDARDYGAQWLTSSGIPDGLLRTDQELTPDQAEQYRRLWHNLDPDTGEARPPRPANERTRVLGKGLTYEPLLIKPSDAQFLESQQFSTTEIARMLGIPAAMLEAATDGKTQTYSNISQQWISYVRFGLMQALREIETALTSLTPSTQQVRFTVDDLDRADRASRYAGYKDALEAGFMTVEEVRAAEGLGPLPATARTRESIQ